MAKRKSVVMRQELRKLLNEWFVSETCDYCQHVLTFRDDDGRHPCNRCEAYERFKLADCMDADLDDKVNLILDLFKNR